jgi:hypothetical protein
VSEVKDVSPILAERSEIDSTSDGESESSVFDELCMELALVDATNEDLGSGDVSGSNELVGSEAEVLMLVYDARLLGSSLSDKDLVIAELES